MSIRVFKIATLYEWKIFSALKLIAFRIIYMSLVSQKKKKKIDNI